MKKIIKNFIKYMFLFILIYCGLYIDTFVIKEEHLWRTDMTINETYKLDGFGFSYHDSDSIFLKILDKKPFNICIIVGELATYNEEYLIGKIGEEKYDYASCGEFLKYNNKYFYINYEDKNDAKFNLTEKEIKEKFPEEIKYMTARNFLNYYGEGNLATSRTTLKFLIFLETLIIMLFIMIIVKLFHKVRNKIQTLNRKEIDTNKSNKKEQ